MKKFNTWVYLSFFTAYLTTNAVSMEFNREFVEKLAKDHIEQTLTLKKTDKTSIEVQPLDPRIVIKDCDKNLIASALEHNNKRNVTVKVSCHGSIPWQLYTVVKIQKLTPILIAQQALQKNTALTQDNVTIEYISSYKVRGEALTSHDNILGVRVKRNIQKGAPIYIQNICVVCKGESVTIIARSKDFRIKTAGTAISDGSFGEQIRVKNNSSGKIITATVQNINHVIVNL